MSLRKPYFHLKKIFLLNHLKFSQIKLLIFLKVTMSYPSNTMICRPHYNSPVDRNLNSKFYLSKKDYPNDSFHTYCDGGAYMFTIDLATKFFIEALHTESFKFEDIHVGYLAKTLNVMFVDISERYEVNRYVFNEKSANEARPSDVDQLWFVHVMDRYDVIILWRYFLATFSMHLFGED